MAKKILCTLPNASDNISGIAFEPYEQGGMISVDTVDELTTNRFLKINGYKLIDVGDGGASDGQDGKAPDTGNKAGSDAEGKAETKAKEEEIIPASQSGIASKSHKAAKK